MKTTAVTTTSHTSPPVVVSASQPKSYIGQILVECHRLTIEALLNPPKSILARVIMSATRKDLRIGTLAPLDQTDTGKLYNDYVNYCTLCGVIPRDLEYWHSLRDEQKITTTVVESLMRAKQLRKFHVETLLVSRKVKQYLETLIATGKYLREVPRFFPSMVREKVGTTQSNSLGGAVKRVVVRAVSVSEDLSGYVWQHQHSCVLSSIEPACLRRVDYRLTLFGHVARSQSLPFFFRGTGAPLNIEQPESRPGPLWVYRNSLDVKTLTPSNKERKLPYASKWCSDCEQHVEQSHECPQPCEAHLKHWRYYTTATALKNGHLLLLADVQQREQERLQRLAEFKQTTPAAHRATWVKSFGGLFSHITDATSVADRIRLRDLNTLNVVAPSKPYVGDYVAWENPRACKHINMRSFTFSDGTTIRMCPDCTTCDEEREKILREVNISKPQSEVVKTWDSTLTAEGLSDGRASFHPKLLWGGVDEVQERRDAESFDNAGERVNTAGSVGTDREGEGKDSSSRDRRAKAIFNEEQEHEPLTNSICSWCGEEIWAKQGTHHCPDTSHRQRLHEELPELRVANEWLNYLRLQLQLKELKEKVSK